MRIEQLTFTRFIAAVAIVIFHYGINSFPLNNHLISFFFEHANVSVSYFFILSGFVMIIAYNNKIHIIPINYLKNRFGRIYPAYFLALLLSLLPSVISAKSDSLGLFLNFLMMQAWVPGKALSINFPAWSLSVELFFYLIFPFLFNSIYRKINLRIIAAIIVTIWILSQVLFHLLIYTAAPGQYFYSIQDLHYLPLMHLNEFLAGNLAGLYFVNKKIKQKNYDWHILALVLALPFILFILPPFFDNHNGLLALLFVPIIYFIASNNGKITRFSQSKICIFLGEISFGIYILQYPVWLWISNYRLLKYFHISNLTSGFFIRLFALILLSSLSYLYLETPIRNYIKALKFYSKPAIIPILVVKSPDQLKK